MSSYSFLSGFKCNNENEGKIISDYFWYIQYHFGTTGNIEVPLTSMIAL